MILRVRRLGAALPLAAALAALATVTQIADASHVRPKGATPLRVAFVQAFKPCAAPNRQHGPPLSFPSCSPPTAASDWVTVGTPDSNSADANFEGFVRLDVLRFGAAPPYGASLRITSQLTDVRCRPGTTACGSSNAFDGPDYTGELEINASLRTTDHYNATSAGGGSDPATIVDIPFPVNLTCASTADTSIGASCTINTLQPGIPNDDWYSGKRVVVGITQFQVFDGGSDGAVATSGGNTLFAIQGIFVP
jgi:hypothetical protein